MTAQAAAAAPEAGAGDALIGAAGLRLRIGGPGLCILDCRHELLQPDLGRQQYERAHIPSALFAHLDRDLSGAKGAGTGRHPLPERAALAQRLRDWGIGPGTHVVAYDASQGSFAARAWWLLRWLGHEKVALLDGGWQAWLEHGYPVQSGAGGRPAPGSFVPGAPLQATVAIEQVESLVRDAGAAAPGRQGRPPRLIVDARAPDRYEGRNETIDPVGGHIPGAVNRFWKLNLDEQGRFKPPALLRAEYEAILAGRDPAELILQCGSGVTACHDLLALHLAGLPGAALFPGSWSQWVADPARPVAQGPDPGH